MNVFAHSWYREALKAKLDERFQVFGKPYSRQGLAEFCGVQRSYISKVFNKNGNMSADQLYLACRFLKFKKAEREFLFLLFERENSYLPERRQELDQVVESFRRKHLKTESSIKSKTVAPEDYRMKQFYLNPEMMLTYLLISLPKFRGEITKVTEHLGLSPSRGRQLREQLLELGFIERKKQGYRAIPIDSHLPETSDIFRLYRRLLRLKSLDQLERVDRDKAYTFSTLVNSDPEVRDQIHSLFLDFLKAVREKISAGGTEEVYQLNFDILQWS